MNKGPTYSVYNIMDIRFADPVSAIGANERYVVIGSMMGRIAVFCLPEKKTTLLAELSTENITGITFETFDTFNVAVGDLEILKYKFIVNNAGQTVPDYLRLKNYERETTHNDYCDSCFPLLSNQHLALAYLSQPNETNLIISKDLNTLKIKNVLTNSMEEHRVEMTNYVVPFDFDGNRFAWVEFLSENERNVCVFYADSNYKWNSSINKDFGHISHLKLMPNNKLFLVRKLNLCEIRDIDKDFKLLHSFTHIGDEVIAVDYYINSSKIIMNDMELENIQVNNRDNEKYVKIPVVKNLEGEGDRELVPVNENNVNEENISIFLLDIDGNVNTWENYTISKLYNLYDMKDISQDMKDKQFFSMGYPYYIKVNAGYHIISTDNGVLIIKKASD